MASKPCPFCEIVAGRVAAEMVWEGPQAVAFLDHRPVFPGHVLLVPRQHVETLADLPVDQLAPFFAAGQALSVAVPRALGAQGTFVAINNRVSQSVPHLHLHVVPRTKGDGLKGFFWPRHGYGSDAEIAEVGARIRAVLEP